MRLGIDLDGVVADMESELVRQAESLFGPAVRQPLEAAVEEQAEVAASAAADGPDVPRALDQTASTPLAAAAPIIHRLRLTARQEHRLWRHVATIENFWESLHEIEAGSVAKLAALADERRWEVIFLTKRPETSGATSQRQSQRWLQGCGFNMPSVFVVQGSRGLIATALALDAVIDDRPDNCLDIAVDSKARPLLVWPHSEELLSPSLSRLGVTVKKSFSSCLDLLVEEELAAARPAGVVTRVKRMLGMKTAAASTSS